MENRGCWAVILYFKLKGQAGSEPFSPVRTARVEGDSRRESAQAPGALEPGAGTPLGTKEPVPSPEGSLSEDCLLRTTSTGRDSQGTEAPKPRSPASAWPGLGEGGVMPAGSRARIF